MKTVAISELPNLVAPQGVDTAADRTASLATRAEQAATKLQGEAITAMGRLTRTLVELVATLPPAGSSIRQDLAAGHLQVQRRLERTDRRVRNAFIEQRYQGIARDVARAEAEAFNQVYELEEAVLTESMSVLCQYPAFQRQADRVATMLFEASAARRARRYWRAINKVRHGLNIVADAFGEVRPFPS